QNRSLVTKDDIMRASRRWRDQDDEPVNYHQLDRLIVQVSDSKHILPVADILSRMLERRHNRVVDFEIVVPELLLQQEQRTRAIFNIVLGAIASISLLVGGIGIMNIMLASVLERIKEIGIRMAVGATQTDIVLQFVMEAMIISLSGGIAGIILGVLMSYFIESITDIKTIISPLAVGVSFLVSISVGLVFGISPARRAAAQDPIVSLRYE
ncbi:MAG: FtsX-like permease family protein, partial [Calditrichaeota bacterium]|nr:FtsX-like permease family protein [Calditrichota bacterium]